MQVIKKITMYLGETLTMTVHPEEYLPKTVDYCHFLNRLVFLTQLVVIKKLREFFNITNVELHILPYFTTYVHTC